jgi:hypothetical protein
MAPMISQTMIMTDPVRMTASDGTFAGGSAMRAAGIAASQ